MEQITGNGFIVNFLVWVASFLLISLISILTWLGAKIYDRVASIDRVLSELEKDLRKDLSSLDRRVTAVETILKVTQQ